MNTITDNLIPINFSSYGFTLQGFFSAAPGEGRHPTLVLLHGSPGGNRDVLGIAQAAPEAGWNALVFNYRGFYESEGISSLKNSHEDVFSALSFIKSAEIVKKYGVDVDYIALAGYSYGGNIALITAAGDPSIKHVISIAAADLSKITRKAEKSDIFRAMFVEKMNNRILKGSVKGPGGKTALEELIKYSDNVDLVKHAKKLKDKSLFIIGAVNDRSSTLEEHVLPLIRALQEQKADKLESMILNTNHAFEGKRTELINLVKAWLLKHHPQRKRVTKEIEDKLWALEKQYMERYKDKDLEKLQEFWHQDFIGWPDWAEQPVNVDNAISRLSKPAQYKIISFGIRPQNILLKGDLAIIYYFIDLKLETKQNKRLSATSRIIHTWIKKQGGWQILGGMSAK